MTIVFENGFQEIYLPGVDNKTVPLEIRPHISGWKEDITLPLEVWDGVWTMNSSKQFTVTHNEHPVEKIELSAGLLINCVMKEDAESIFSVTFDEAEAGNSRFDKYFHDAATTPWISIGSSEGSYIRYNNKFCSPKHAEIVFDGGAARVKDMNSVNGTFVNGRLLTGEHTLKYGDVIYIIGLKILYLNNVIAVNNPKGVCTVDDLKLKPIKIESAVDSEEHEYEADDNYFLRTPRKIEVLDDETFTIEKCPAQNKQKRPPIFLTIGPAFTMMIPMVVGTMMMGGEGSLASGLIMTIGSALLGGMWAMLNMRYQKKEETETEAQRVHNYTAYMAKNASKIAERMEYNKGVLQRTYPSGAEAASFADNGSHRLWEKSSIHADFLSVRLGLGDIPSPNEIVVPKEQLMAEHDPLNDKVEEIKAQMSTLRQVPVALSLYNNRIVGVVSGDRSRVLGVANLLAVQLAGLHPYTDVRMCFVYPIKETDDWQFARFLPHSWSADGKLRMIACDKLTVGDVMYHLSGIIRERLERTKEAEESDEKVLPHYVVTIADWSLIEDEPIAKFLMNPTPELGITTIFLTDAIDKLPSGCTAIVKADQYNGFYSTTGAFTERENVAYDIVDRAMCEKFARNLSNYRVREPGTSTAIPDVLSFLDMYKTSKVEDLDMLHKWLENRTYESMKSMVGYKSGNQPLYLDIHEKFHGPHGLVAGTTGSGKSETLQSYILSLVVNYHPHEVAFILIDYKGGGMAQSFLGLPHLSGVITNLGGNATNRALLSINAEIKSRQRIFNDYKVKHIDAYIELYRSGVATEPMPHLLIIADEFAELKKEQPDFVRALVSAARVGRSLGVNLILATQKPSGVVDDEIWSNTRFRLCLRVADKQDSGEMIKRPDAAYITGTGRGYFQVGNDEIFEEFQSGWSGAEYEPDVPFTDDRNAKVELINLIGKSGVPKQKKKKKSDNIAKVTQLDAVVKYAAKIAEENNIPAIKQIWMPPLPKKLYLEELAEIPKPEGFSVLLPIGLVDNPEGQNQYPVAVDFMADGHLLICGSGGSGKTGLLQTLIYSAVTRYTAKEINIYIADFSSRTMAVFGSLPSVGGILFEGDDEKIAETFELLQNTLAQRKSEFSGQGIGSFKEYVTQKDDCPAILFFIDNYVAFIESYEQYEDTLAQLSREAASYGIYLVLTMNNSGELRSRIRQNFTSGIALQMSDKYEYEAVVGDRTETIPEGRTAGRGLIKAPLPVEFQVALCVREDEGLSQAQTLRRKFSAMKAEDGAGIKKIGDTIDELGYEALLARTDVKDLPKNKIAIGIDTEEGKPVTVNLDDEFCYTVGGGGGSGKTNLLAAVAKQCKAKDCRLFLFGEEGSKLEETKLFEKTTHSDSDLFSLMEDVLVPEFSRRNGIVADTRDAGGDIIKALEKDERIVFIIDDIRGFINAVYSTKMDMSGFLEIALEKGLHHKIQFFAAITPDDYADLARYACMRIFAGYGRGVHLGGMFDQQGILRFELSAADQVRQLNPGVGYALRENKAVRFITPLVKEVSAEVVTV
jgi:S-DNA-T family DNA segregation ATPase FtsK/SpoIIIE